MKLRPSAVLLNAKRETQNAEGLKSKVEGHNIKTAVILREA